MAEDEFEALMPKMEDDIIGSKYRYVFSSPMGREVLADLLFLCHLFDVPDSNNPQKCGEQGIGIGILGRCGILGPNSMRDVINALLNVIPRTKEVEK